MDALLSFIHFFHASMPSFCRSGVELCFIFSNSGPEAIYSTMNFFIGASLGLLQIHSDGEIYLLPHVRKTES